MYLNTCAALQEEGALPMLHLQSPYNTPAGHRTLWLSEDPHPLSFNHVSSVADEFKYLMTLSPTTPKSVPAPPLDCTHRNSSKSCCLSIEKKTWESPSLYSVPVNAETVTFCQIKWSVGSDIMSLTVAALLLGGRIPIKETGQNDLA